MSPIEIVGVLVSALAIALTAKRKMSCWPVGLVSVAVYGWIFYDAKLYSDMLLQGAFAVMQLYGWWHWVARAAKRTGRDAAGGTDPVVRVQPASWRTLLPGLLAGVIGSIVLGGVMSHYTDAALPWVDASLSSFSLVAQYWTARKYLASWGLWTVVDCIYVGMFVFKDLYPTAALYAFFVFLAVTGWREWKRNLDAQRATDTPLAMPGGAAPRNAFDNDGRAPVRGGSRTGVRSDAAEPAQRAHRGDWSDEGGAQGQFGVSGMQAVRDWPMMIQSEIAGVLASYPVEGEIDHLRWHSPRPFAAAALVQMSSGQTLFVKRHHRRVRDLAALTEEHQFIRHLAANGMMVVDVLSDRLGRTAIQIDEWIYEVHRQAEGIDVYRNVMSWEPFKVTAHAYAAGCALARLHLAAAGYTAPPRATRLLVSSFQVIGAEDLMGAAQAWIDAQPLMAAALASRPWQRDLAAVIGPYHASLAPLLSGLPPLWTHGDWHASNLLWSASGEDAYVQSVLDFGLSDQSCALMDLALAIERNTIEWLVEPARRAVHLDHVDALLDGYASVEPLSARDYRVLIALLPIVHTEFALSEVAYFDGVLRQPRDADIAYDDYLLGHARWFGEPAGRALLTHLAARRDAIRGRV